jgi:hypothetical protein
MGKVTLGHTNFKALKQIRKKSATFVKESYLKQKTKKKSEETEFTIQTKRQLDKNNAEKCIQIQEQEVRKGVTKPIIKAINQ